MNFLLDVNSLESAFKAENLWDTALYGAQLLLIAALAILGIYILLRLAKTLFGSLSDGGSAGSKGSNDTKFESASPQYASTTSSTDEIVAVIAAAIAMAESESGGNTKFRVVSFRRK